MPKTWQQNAIKNAKNTQNSHKINRTFNKKVKHINKQKNKPKKLN